MAFVTFPFSTRNIFFSLLLVLIWINIPNTASAQSVYEQIGRLPTTIYTQEEIGSLSPIFWTATQSDAGLMYFGSGSNLYEYDGVSWRQVFKTDNLVRTLSKNPNGMIFYGGLDFGYLEADSTGETQGISLIHLIPEELRVNFQIWSINFLNEHILIQTNSHIIRLQLEEDFTLKSLKSWQAETAFTMSFLHGKEYFIGQVGKGLYQLIDDEVKLIPGTEMLGQDRIGIMHQFANDSIKTFILGGYSIGFYLLSEKGLSKYPTQVDTLLNEGTSLYRASIQNGNYVLSLLGGGVVIMSPQAKILRKFDATQGLPSDVVYNTYEDQAGGLWVLTDDGIARVAINSPIQTFGKELGINSTVQSIQKNGDELYLGTNNGLVKFDSEEKVFSSVSDIKTGQIIQLLDDGEDLLVAGGSLKVLRDGKSIQLEGAKDRSSTITLLIPKATPNLMFVGTSSELSVYQRGLSKDVPWEYAGKVPGIDSGIGYLFEDKEGQVLAVGAGVISLVSLGESGLEAGNLNNIKITGFEFSINAFGSLVDGQLFLNTPEEGTGWQKFSNSESKFIPAEEFKALGDEMIDLNQNQSEILWMQSKNGKKYILKRQADGTFIKDDKPNVIAPYLSQVDFVDEDSIFWFGSPKGLVRYDPKKDVQDEKQFFTLIRRIESKTDTLPLFQYGRNASIVARESKDNSLRFEFAAPYFEEEKKTKYQTFMEGFESDWVDWNDNRFKEYTNLSPGEYTFRVRALANSGQISEEASYSFVVLPPWYATWWAYILYVLLVILIITAIVKWRSKKLKAENRILEERVRERTAQLEKSITDLKSTQDQLIHSEKMASLGELTAGIAHEIQNPLNFVNNFSELNAELIEDLEKEIENGNLDEIKALAVDIKANDEKINHHGRRADAIVKGMLQHSRSNSGQKVSTDLNTLADEYLRLSYHGLRAKDKTFEANFTTDFDPNLPKVDLVAQDLGRVILNLINNAFYAVNEKAKEGIEGYFPEVFVGSKKTEEGVSLTIKDNGNGIPDAIKDKIFQPFFTTKPTGQGTGLGLSLSYDIIKAHGGELSVESEVGKGSEFLINLPYI